MCALRNCLVSDFLLITQHVRRSWIASLAYQKVLSKLRWQCWHIDQDLTDLCKVSTVIKHSDRKAKAKAKVKVKIPRRVHAYWLKQLSTGVYVLECWLCLCYHLQLQHRTSESIFTARRYAKRGICRRRVSVCVSVTQAYTPVLHQNGSRNQCHTIAPGLWFSDAKDHSEIRTG